jgi:O-antigen/teichoic acid export membrane protein
VIKILSGPAEYLKRINYKSIKTRFLVTLFANAARLFLTLCTGIIVARYLAPVEYGNFTFLLGSFASIMMLLDLGTSSAFYTFISQSKRSSKFYFYYFMWLAAQFIVVLLLVSYILPDALRKAIWLSHSKEIVILSFLASFTMNKIWQTVTQSGESVRATIIVQAYNIILAVAYLAALLIILSFRHLTIYNIYVVAIVVYGSFSFMLAKRLKNSLILNDAPGPGNIAVEFRAYCMPLIIYSVVSFLYSFTDLWFLQKFGGAMQQGFYSVSLNLSAICLVATSSMLNILWKEMAESNKIGDKARLYYLYSRISKGLYFLGAVSACFLIPFTREILAVLLGPAYEAAWACMAIMLLYPIYQSLGQVNAIYFYATSQTKIYTILGVVTMIASIPLTYLMLAPASYRVGGLGLGSMGLSLKMIILSIIPVNIGIHIISKRLGQEYDFLYQFKILIVFLTASFVIRKLLYLIMHISNITLGPLFVVVMALPVYILIIVCMVYFLPDFSGIKVEKRFFSYFLNKA